MRVRTIQLAASLILATVTTSLVVATTQPATSPSTNQQIDLARIVAQPSWVGAWSNNRIDRGLAQNAADRGRSGLQSFELAPRTPVTKPTSIARPSDDPNARLMVKFRDDHLVRALPDGRPISLSSADLTEMTQLLGRHGLTLQPTITHEADLVDGVLAKAAYRSGQAQPDLLGQFYVVGPQRSVDRAARAILESDTVEYAIFKSSPEVLAGAAAPQESDGLGPLWGEDPPRIETHTGELNPSGPSMEWPFGLGACCGLANVDLCTDNVSFEACTVVQGGLWLGAGTDCASANCEDSWHNNTDPFADGQAGACCLPSYIVDPGPPLISNGGYCLQTLEDVCGLIFEPFNGNAGVWAGSGTSCFHDVTCEGSTEVGVCILPGDDGCVSGVDPVTCLDEGGEYYPYIRDCNHQELRGGDGNGFGACCDAILDLACRLDYTCRDFGEFYCAAIHRYWQGLETECGDDAEGACSGEECGFEAFNECSLDQTIPANNPDYERCGVRATPWCGDEGELTEDCCEFICDDLLPACCEDPGIGGWGPLCASLANAYCIQPMTPPASGCMATYVFNNQCWDQADASNSSQIRPAPFPARSGIRGCIDTECCELVRDLVPFGPDCVLSNWSGACAAAARDLCYSDPSLIDTPDFNDYQTYFYEAPANLNVPFAPGFIEHPDWLIAPSNDSTQYIMPGRPLQPPFPAPAEEAYLFGWYTMEGFDYFQNPAIPYSGLLGVGQMMEDMGRGLNGTQGRNVQIAVLARGAFVQQYDTIDPDGETHTWGAVHEMLGHVKLEGRDTDHPEVHILFDPQMDEVTATGTAILSVIGADWGGDPTNMEPGTQHSGTLGLAPEADLFFFPLQTVENAWREQDAWLSALSILEVGDVLCAPYSSSGDPNLLYQEDIWPLIQVAKSIGAHTVISAGDEDINLDEEEMVGPSEDNNAIVVGACMPGVGGFYALQNLQRFPRSNYVQTPNAQILTMCGWGTGIVTAGGDGRLTNLTILPQDELGNPVAAWEDAPSYVYNSKRYTNNFGGTRGAAAQVAALVADISSFAKQLYEGVSIGTAQMQTNFSTSGDTTLGRVDDTISEMDMIDEDPRNMVGGFPSPGVMARAVIHEPGFGFDESPFFDYVQVIRGEGFTGNRWALMLADGQYLGIKSEETNAGVYTPPFDIPGGNVTYPSTGELTDLMIVGKLDAGQFLGNTLTLSLTMMPTYGRRSLLRTEMFDWTLGIWRQAARTQLFDGELPEGDPGDPDYTLTQQFDLPINYASSFIKPSDLSVALRLITISGTVPPPPGGGPGQDPSYPVYYDVVSLGGASLGPGLPRPPSG